MTRQRVLRLLLLVALLGVARVTDVLASECYNGYCWYDGEYALALCGGGSGQGAACNNLCGGDYDWPHWCEESGTVFVCDCVPWPE